MRYRCYGKNLQGLIKVYGWGNSKREAIDNATQAAWDYIQHYERTHKWELPSHWTYTTEDRRREFEMIRSVNMERWKRFHFRSS